MRGTGACRATETHESEGKAKSEKRGGRGLPVVVAITVIRQRHDDAQRVLDAEERALRSFSEARRPRPLQDTLLVPQQRPCEGDASVHREPPRGMQAFGAFADMIARVEGNIDPLVPWQEGVGVLENKRARGGQQANIVECVDGMCFTKGLVWWLVLLGGDRIACRICTRSRRILNDLLQFEREL